jgi:hypothetical protein
MTYLCFLNITLLEDQLQDLILIRSAELVLKCAFACCVEDTLRAMADIGQKVDFAVGAGIDLLVGDEDLEAADNLCKRDARVLFPVLDGLGAVDEDDEILGLALVVDLGLGSITASHDVFL